MKKLIALVSFAYSKDGPKLAQFVITFLIFRFFIVIWPINFNFPWILYVFATFICM